MTRVLVTGAGSLIGEGIIRSLKRSSFDFFIVGTDYFNHAAGLYWVDKGYLLPDILSEEVDKKQWLERVVEICTKENIAIICIGLDFEVDLFAEYSAEIQERTGAKVVVAKKEAIEICKDKWKTAEFLKDNGLFYPQSCLPENYEELVKQVGFPLIVKPRSGFRSSNVYRVKSLVDLEEALKKCPDPVIQEEVGSPDQEYTCGVLNLGGEVASCVCLRRDLKEGNTWRAYSEKVDGIQAYLQKVSEKLSLEGPANYQLRLTDKGPVIFEINPRFSGTTSSRALLGVNEVEMAIRYYVNNETVLHQETKEGVILRFIDEQFIPMKEYRKWEK